MGNPLSSTLGSSTTTFTYSSPTPKLTTVTRTGEPPISVTYDNAGNELQATSTQSISPRNLVSNIATPATRLFNAYDGRGVRVESKRYPAPPAGWTSMIRHVYSPELRPLTRYEYENHLGLPRLRHVTDYVWFADRPIAQVDVTGTPVITTTAADHLGTPYLQTDATAAVVWRAEYDPYGTVVQMRTGNEAGQPLRFPGQEAVTGVTERYNVFRWYRAGWGRYTQADPIGLEGGLNSFSYAGENPLKYVDPDGLAYQYCQLYPPKDPHHPKLPAGDVPLYVDTIEIPKFDILDFTEKLFGDDSFAVITKRQCRWRCYCWPTNSCYKIPCKGSKTGKCKLDHGVQVIRKYFNKWGVKPCGTFTPEIVAAGDCGGD